MIKKVICLGLIVMMILVVISGVYGSYVREIEKKRIIQGKSVTIVTYGVYSNNGGLLREFISSAEANTYLASISGSVESRPNYGAPRVGVSRSGGSVSQPRYSDVKFWYEGIFYDLGRKNWGDKVKAGGIEFTVGQGYVYPSTHTGAISYSTEDKKPVSQPSQIVGGSSGTRFHLQREITIPGTDKKTPDGRISGDYVTLIYGKEEYRFKKNSDGTFERKFKIENGKLVELQDWEKTEASELLNRWSDFEEGILASSGGEEGIPKPGTETPPTVTGDGKEGPTESKGESDRSKPLIREPKSDNVGELLLEAVRLENEKEYSSALDYWKQIEEKTRNTNIPEYKNLHEEAEKSIKKINDIFEQERRKQQGIANTAGILKGRLWGALNGFFGDYSFGIPSKVCQSVFSTAPVGESLGFMDVREPGDYKFKNNVATIQGYKSDYSYKEVKRYVYEVSYSLYAGEENLAYGVFFAGESVFVEQGDVNLGDVKRGYFVKESEKEYKTVCMKYSSGSICGNLKES